MHYRRLGRSGLKVSEISFGTWITFGNQIEEQVANDLIHTAYDAGVNFFDTADVYANGRSEEVLGKAIRDLPRPALVISSKVFWPTMPVRTGAAVNTSPGRSTPRRRLGTDYLDHTSATTTTGHRRGAHHVRPDPPGKILYWGTSEWMRPK